MLYIFYGSDNVKSVDKARTLVNSLRAKRPEATYIEINQDNYSPNVIDEHIGGQGLFSNKYIIFLNGIAFDEESKNKIIGVASFMKDSDNIFIINEGKINAELKKTFDKYGNKVVVTDLVEKKNDKGEFNIFALADAVSSRNSFKAWSIYREAIQNGLESESILGTIFWQLKSMIVSSFSKTANEAGLSPFVFSKAKKGCTNYKPEELKNLLDQSISLYHDSHRGLIDMELGIERMLLRL